MTRIAFAVLAAALFVWGPGIMPKPTAGGIGLVKADRVYVANAVARFDVDVR